MGMSVSGGWKGLPAKPRRPLKARPFVVIAGATLKCRMSPSFTLSPTLASFIAGRLAVNPFCQSALFKVASRERLDGVTDAGNQWAPLEALSEPQRRAVYEIVCS